MFHEHTLKCAQHVENCTLAYDLQGNGKLHLGIRTLITVRSLEARVNNRLGRVLNFTIPSEK